VCKEGWRATGMVWRRSQQVYKLHKLCHPQSYLSRDSSCQWNHQTRSSPSDKNSSTAKIDFLGRWSRDISCAQKTWNDLFYKHLFHHEPWSLHTTQPLWLGVLHLRSIVGKESRNRSEKFPLRVRKVPHFRRFEKYLGRLLHEVPPSGPLESIRTTCNRNLVIPEQAPLV
jgi:hypothetical protein